MRRLLCVFAVLVVPVTISAAGEIDADLQALLKDTPANEPVSALVYLVDQVDVVALSNQLERTRSTRATRHETVVRALQDVADATQPALLADLSSRLRDGSVFDYRAFWLGNIIEVEATPAMIREIAARDDVEWVFPNYEIELITPVNEPEEIDEGGLRSPEPGVDAVRAPEVWALGYDGTGILVANMDTGVDGNHPALASRWAGVADPRYAGHPEWAWYDPYNGQNNFPYDDGGHGTHTMGSVCGGSPGDQIGVAPGAYWMASAPIDRGGGIPQTVADAILSFQWMTDPDGNPSTSWDVPRVCSNSWGVTESMGYPDCDTTFWSFIDACEAAGTIILFSAGNEGSNGLRKPPDRATTDYNVCAVAAVDANSGSWPIASFSSRGPTYCTPTGDVATKPDIAAPGVDVRSSYPGGGYTSLSGTSMASPHVNGVVALMLQANPDLSSQQVKQIIYDTAYDLGPAGEDNSYGWGMIDAYEAVQLALSTVNLTYSFPDGFPEYIDPNGGTSIRVVITGQTVQPQPGTGQLHYSIGPSYTTVDMVEVSPNVYDAVFPAFPCGSEVNYYFSVETMDGEVVRNPYQAPAQSYSGLAYTGLQVYFADDFESNLGWTVYAGADTGDFERADPQFVEVNEGSWWNPQWVTTQPGDDHSANGVRCYVTGAAAGSSAGDYDLDGGPTRLTSPVLELEGTDATVSYWRWFFIGTELNDQLVVEVSNNGGSSWTVAETVSNRSGWTRAEWRVSDFVTPTNNVRVRFSVSDSPNDSLTEVLIDDFSVDAYYCDEPAYEQGDMNCDGVINNFDIDAFVLAITDPAGYDAAYPDCGVGYGDINGDGETNNFDIDPFVALLTD